MVHKKKEIKKEEWIAVPALEWFRRKGYEADEGWRGDIVRVKASDYSSKAYWNKPIHKKKFDAFIDKQFKGR